MLVCGLVWQPVRVLGVHCHYDSTVNSNPLRGILPWGARRFTLASLPKLGFMPPVAAWKTEGSESISPTLKLVKLFTSL